ncbi:MAG: PQQ-binding-like beta-propeller repeat protein [Planctomycetota bacterium]|nr:PQQ-binding-like beta-propeller repeat protein [Planctomycetota bacterium]
MGRGVLAVTALCAWFLGAADWPQYRGPHHDGSTPETILTHWPNEGPKVLWRVPLGDGFGSFVVSGGKAFIFMERAVGGTASEVCVAFDASTGKELWASSAGPTIHENLGGNGPRSTPAADGERVYLLGTFLKLVCVNAADGSEVWAHELTREFGGNLQLQTSGINSWGSAASPVLDGNLVFVNGGGKRQALMAFDKKTGAVVWKGETELLTHSTPVPATILGTRQIVFLCKSGLVSLAAETGTVLWRHPFKFSVSTASTPVVSGDIVYCSAAYDVGTDACRIEKTDAGYTATKLWHKDQPLCHHWTTPVCKDGYVYGIYGFKDFVQAGKPGAPLKCVEIATGNEMWSQPGFGSGGATVLVGNHVLARTDAGTLVLVEATPKAYTEVARATPLGGRCWTMPAVSGGRIYLRNNDQTRKDAKGAIVSRPEGMCVDVKSDK